MYPCMVWHNACMNASPFHPGTYKALQIQSSAHAKNNDTVGYPGRQCLRSAAAHLPGTRPPMRRTSLHTAGKLYPARSEPHPALQLTAHIEHEPCVSRLRRRASCAIPDSPNGTANRLTVTARTALEHCSSIQLRSQLRCNVSAYIR